MRIITRAFLAAAVAATISACAAESENDEVEWTAEIAPDGSKTAILLEDGVESVDGVTINVVLSFFATCTNPYAQGVGNAATYAQASSCRRRNGTWTGFRSWSGWCTGNLSNNDGNIVCGP